MALLVASAFAGGAVASRVASATPVQASPFAMFDPMAKALMFVENAYVDPTSRDRLVEGALKGMVAELDPHSAYMNPEEYAEFRSDSEGRFGGIGVEVDFRDDQVTVIAPIEGSPAARAGIRSGDRIVTIDGRSTRAVRADKLVRLMRGEPGTPVSIEVVRTGEAKPLTFRLLREIVEVASVEGKRLASDIAYIRLKQFQSNSHSELLAELGRQRKQAKTAIAGLILDLRNDPGGLVDQAEAIANEFLDQGVIYSTRHRGRVVDEVRARPGGVLVGVPTIVLLNEYSASSSELLAGALRDNGRATLLGTRTFGKGSVQTIFEMPSGGGLRLTTMRYFTPSGRTIQAEGIAPDIWIMAADGPSNVPNEASLEGHLPGDAPRSEVASAARLTAPKDDQPLAKISDMPIDPLKGNDFSLTEAWRRLSARRAAEPAR